MLTRSYEKENIVSPIWRLMIWNPLGLPPPLLYCHRVAENFQRRTTFPYQIGGPRVWTDSYTFAAHEHGAGCTQSGRGVGRYIPPVSVLVSSKTGSFSDAGAVSDSKSSITSD